MIIRIENETYCVDDKTSVTMMRKIIDSMYTAGVKSGLTVLLEELEQIDDCEFAMFSLGLIKEKIEEITGNKTKENKDESKN